MLTVGYVAFLSAAPDVFEPGKRVPGSEQHQWSPAGLQTRTGFDNQVLGVREQPEDDPLFAVLPFSVQHHLSCVQR